MLLKSRRNKISESNLEEVLRECSAIAKKSANVANDNLDFIKDSIDKAIKAVKECATEILKLKVKDSSAVITLSEQLKKINDEFVKDYTEVKNIVQSKATEVENFNITLFGRTKVGKSTLMEILTNGDGKSIGKGGQRTTLDVRKYKWNGLNITDIPGIDAFNGETDDRIAFEAAKKADLILFMISDGQPEATEADWLVNLKREDKPILCLCNAKRTLNSDLDLEIFLDDPSKILDNQRVFEIINQFKHFVHEKLPNEKIDILVTQLQARFIANNPKYLSYKHSLINASRFEYVEDAIKQLVISNGISYRKKCFLSIIDVPLYNQSIEFYKQSEKTYQAFLLVNEKYSDFLAWSNENPKQNRQQLINAIDKEYEELIECIPAFVEDNFNTPDFIDKWKKLVDSRGIDKNIAKYKIKYEDKVINKVKEYFQELENEISITTALNSNSNSNSNSIENPQKVRNWGRILERVSLVIGAIATIGSLVFGLPKLAIGIATGVGILLGIIESSLESYSEKERKEKIKLQKKLRYPIIKTKKQVKDNCYKAYTNDIIKGVIREANNRFRIMKGTLLTLTNTERELAYQYMQHHKLISKQLILSILEEMGANKSLLKHIDFVARIPGRKTVIGCLDEEISNIALSKIGEKIGNNEEIRILRSPLNRDLKNNISLLEKYFHLKNIDGKLQYIESSNQYVLYIRKDYAYSEREDCNLLLMQQILNIHIIKR